MTASACLVSRHLGLIGRAIGSSAIERLEWAFMTASKLSGLTVSIHSVALSIYSMMLFNVESK